MLHCNDNQIHANENQIFFINDITKEVVPSVGEVRGYSKALLANINFFALYNLYQIENVHVLSCTSLYLGNYLKETIELVDKDINTILFIETYQISNKWK